MKENKSWAFALNVFLSEKEENIGYLVFPDDKQAFDFMTFSDKLNANTPSLLENEKNNYTVHNWVVLDEMISEKVHSNGALFIDKVVDADDAVLKEIQAIKNSY